MVVPDFLSLSKLICQYPLNSTSCSSLLWDLWRRTVIMNARAAVRLDSSSWRTWFMKNRFLDLVLPEGEDG